jgi:hypothetical protein
MKINQPTPAAARKQVLASLLSIFLFFISFQFISSACKKDTSIFAEGTANDFLSGKYYPSLVVEIQYMQGFRPSAQTLSNLNTFLQARLNKPGGITFVIDSIPAMHKTYYSLDDATTIEQANRSQNKNGTRMAAYFLFVDGDYAANPSGGKILGIAYSYTSVIIFEKTIRDYSGGLGQPQLSVLEGSVAEHEFGHLLGLVNNGTTMRSKHQDTPNGRHCTNQNCLMYYNVETNNVVANLLGGNIPQLDANCINDLRGNGGK